MKSTAITLAAVLTMGGTLVFAGPAAAQEEELPPCSEFTDRELEEIAADAEGDGLYLAEANPEAIAGLGEEEADDIEPVCSDEDDRGRPVVLVVVPEKFKDIRSPEGSNVRRRAGFVGPGPYGGYHHLPMERTLVRR